MRLSRVMQRFGPAPLIVGAVVLALILTTIGVVGIGKVAAKATTQPLVQRLNPMPEKHTIHGTITVMGVSGCSLGGLTSGYGDLQPGGNVTVTNEHDTVIATGSLESGSFHDEFPGSSALSVGECVFPFTVEVPRASFYSIEVTHRGKLTSSYDEMVSNNWTFASSLG